MSKLAFKQTITKKAFIAKLAHDFGTDGLTKCAHREEACYGSPAANMTLFYSDGKHIGTWMKGVGWIFQSAYNSVTA